MYKRLKSVSKWGILCILFWPTLTLSADKIPPLGSVFVNHKCFNSEFLDNALIENKEKQRLRMIGPNKRSLFEVWYSDDRTNWTILVRTRMPGNTYVSCVVGAVMEGAVLETKELSNKELTY